MQYRFWKDFIFQLWNSSDYMKSNIPTFAKFPSNQIHICSIENNIISLTVKPALNQIVINPTLHYGLTKILWNLKILSSDQELDRGYGSTKKTPN